MHATGWPLADPLAVAVALQPGLVKASRRVQCRVEVRHVLVQRSSWAVICARRARLRLFQVAALLSPCACCHRALPWPTQVRSDELAGLSVVRSVAPSVSRSGVQLVTAVDDAAYASLVLQCFN